MARKSNELSADQRAYITLFLEALRQTHLYHLKVNPGSDKSGLPQTIAEFKQAFIVFRAGHIPIAQISPSSALKFGKTWSTDEGPKRTMIKVKAPKVTYTQAFFDREHVVCFEGKFDKHLDESMFRAFLQITAPKVDNGIMVDDLQIAFSKAAEKDLGSADNTASLPVFVQSKQVSVKLSIQNNTPQNLKLASIEALYGKVNLKPKKLANVAQNSNATVDLEFTPLNLGQCRFLVSFKFADGSVIQKWVTIRVIDSKFHDLMRDLKPKEKYSRRVYRNAKASSTIAGVRPGTFQSVLNGLKPLKPYEIPVGFKKQVKAYHNSAKTDRQAPEDYFAGGALNEENYGKYFQTCLNLEEMQMNVDIRTYDMDNVMFSMTRDRKFLMLDVPGLAEKRPSVVYGDRIFAMKLGDRSNKQYEGYVHKVEAERIFVMFHSSFHQTFVAGERHSVRFTFSRTLLKRSHRGAEILGDNLQKVIPWIFPNELDSRVELNEAKPEVAVRNLNEKQNRAVQAIVSRSHGYAPFMIFGPPGTGKTTTLVEAIIAYSKVNHGKILVMAPSNNAADYLCFKLSTVFGPSQMFRIHAFQRSVESLAYANVVMKHSFVNADGHFAIPSNIKNYRIIVSTCASASYAWDAGLDAISNGGKSYFDAIFVDEAGHATETEFWSSIACFVEGTTDSTKALLPSLVVAGDPRQLGPVIRSPLAVKLKFDISFMERLIDTCDLYNEGKDGFDGRFVVKLVNNYRSHPDILNIYSDLFYSGELVKCADPVSANAFVGFEELSNPKIPIQFHGVVGCDEREGNSPSWMNLDEIQLVMQWISKILASKGRGISPQSIGVITPYRKQVQKLRVALKKKPEYDGILVGTCEEFQGQEKSVIIISTVRSATEHLKSDLKFNLGFIFSKKRFNVAISRAKAMIVAIGNPHVLVKDPNWKHLLDFCQSNGCVCGEQPPTEQSPDNQELALDQDVVEDEDEFDRAVEAEWEIIR